MVRTGVMARWGVAQGDGVVRGGMVRKVVGVLAAVALAWAMVGMVLPAVARSMDAATPTVTYTVRPGDTLWFYAAAITPAGGDVSVTVDELVRLNDLDGVALQVGQSIRVPER